MPHNAGGGQFLLAKYTIKLHIFSKNLPLKVILQIN